MSFSFLTHPQAACSPTTSRNQKHGLKRKKERMKGIFIVQLLQSQVLQLPSYPTPCFLTLSSPNPTFLQPKPLLKTKNLRLKTQKEKKGIFIVQLLQSPSSPNPKLSNPMSSSLGFPNLKLSNPRFSKPQVVQPHVPKPWVSKP